MQLVDGMCNKSRATCCMSGRDLKHADRKHSSRKRVKLSKKNVKSHVFGFSKKNVKNVKNVTLITCIVGLNF